MFRTPFSVCVVVDFPPLLSVGASLLTRQVSDGTLSTLASTEMVVKHVHIPLLCKGSKHVLHDHGVFFVWIGYVCLKPGVGSLLGLDTYVLNQA